MYTPNYDKCSEISFDIILILCIDQMLKPSDTKIFLRQPGRIQGLRDL